MGLGRSWDGEKDTHADFTRGGVNPEDFEEQPTRHKKASKKRRPKRGCPGNDFKEHVYIWEPLRFRYTWDDEALDDFYEIHGFYRREVLICCGCGRRQKTRYTEEMKKRIKKFGWYNANYMR